MRFVDARYGLKSGVKVGGVKVGGAMVGGAKVGGTKVGGAKVGGAKYYLLLLNCFKPTA